jgi:hypothetical protein
MNGHNRLSTLVLVCVAAGFVFGRCRETKSVQHYDGKKWMGKWSRHTWQNEAGLDITAWANDSLTFSMHAGSGGHTGEVEGNALFNDSTATYYSANENDTCIIHFRLFGDSLIVVNVEKGNCFAGMAVTYDGNYYAAKYHSKEEDNKPKTFVDLGILDSAQDALLKSVTGDDYHRFFASTQLTSTDDDDMDSLHAKVYASGIRGLFTEMENIIMIDSSSHIWAAVLDDSKVFYYTNNHDDAGKLPKTIEHWRERFKQDTVMYKSMP